MNIFEENKDYVIAELEKGRSMRSVAREFGKYASSLRYWINANEITIDKSKNQLIAKVKVMADEGLTLDVMSMILGKHKSILSRLINKHGITLHRAKQLNKISLNDLKSNWADVDRAYVVTIARKPKFYLVPITD